MDKEKLKEQQNQMRDQIEIPEGKHFKMRKHELIFSFDIQYEGEVGFVAVDIQSYGGDHKGTFVGRYPATVEYQPGYFAFREGPLLQAALEDVKNKLRFHPSLLVIDGHGQAHPRRMGVATWLGIKTQTPSIGIAKEPLLKTPFKNELGLNKGDVVDVLLEEKKVGFVLRSQTNVNPIFVSAGHRISQEEALRIAKKLSGEYRVVEPIRRADKMARSAAKGEVVLDL